MKKHLVGLFFCTLTFGLSLLISPRAFHEVGRGAAAIGEQPCLARKFLSNFGEEVIQWSCSAINPYRSLQEDFEFNVEKYTTISRSESRAVVTYFTGDLRGYCVLRLDENKHNEVCSASLETTLEFERQYLAEGN
jgi:hypothetical protein